MSMPIASVEHSINGQLMDSHSGPWPVREWPGHGGKDGKRES